MAGWNPFWAGNPAAIGQQTRAGQIIAMNGSGRMAAPRRRRKSKMKAAAPRRAGPKRKSSRARLVKGSAAAKAYMAKIRRKRR